MERWGDSLRVAARFVFCGIPGVLVFLVASGLFLQVFFLGPRGIADLPQLLLPAGCAVGGLVLALYGAGRLCERRYAFVFLAIPLTVVALGLLNDQVLHLGGKGEEMAAGAFLVALLVYRWVR